MNLRDLKYLVAIADHMHFGKAAASCFVSQPALSMQIKKLEALLGVQLIERHPKNVFLTEVGRRVVTQARDVLQRVNTIHEITIHAKNPFAGTLRLGIIPTLAPYFLPHVMSKLSKLFPKLVFYLLEDMTHHLENQLNTCQLDAAIIALPMIKDNFESTPLFEEEFLLAVSKNHHLSKRKTVKLADLEEEKLLLLTEGHCLRDQALSFCQRFAANEVHSFQATSLETLRQMVAINSGITLMPKLAVKSADGLSYISFATHKPQRTIGMVWRTSMAKEVLMQKLACEVRKIMYQTNKVKIFNTAMICR